MMKKFITYISIGLMVTLFHSCGWFAEDDPIEPNFEDQISETIYDYIVQQDTINNQYGDFLKILEVAQIDKTLSAYNPEGFGYTLFLPTNEAIAEFITESDEYSSLDQLLADVNFASAFGRYHVVKISIEANDFPFGAMPKLTMSGDYLTVTYVIGEDSTSFKINNQAPVIQEDIEMSNGYIHILGKALKPITNTTYEWLKKNTEFTIFTELVEATGFTDLLSRDMKDEENPISPVTLLAEPDSIFNKRGIYSLADLATFLEAEDTEYTNSKNIVNMFAGYHVLDAYSFLLDFEDQVTNYTTFTELPVRINGLGLDIAINKEKQIFDTIVSGNDTTIIDFVGILYDQSNVLTKSGAIHFVDQVMEPQLPSRARVTFEFRDEPMFLDWRDEGGEFVIEDSAALSVLSWTGPEMTYVKSADSEHPAWSQDYITLDGDFSIKYKIPKVVQGTYNMKFRGLAYGQDNAVIEIFVDGNKVGGLVDLSNIGTSSNPFRTIEVGTIDFTSYEQHVVEVRSLIPGVLEWDHVQFDTDTN